MNAGMEYISQKKLKGLIEIYIPTAYFSNKTNNYITPDPPEFSHSFTLLVQSCRKGW